MCFDFRAVDDGDASNAAEYEILKRFRSGGAAVEQAYTRFLESRLPLLSPNPENPQKSLRFGDCDGGFGNFEAGDREFTWVGDRIWSCLSRRRRRPSSSSGRLFSFSLGFLVWEFGE